MPESYRGNLYLIVYQAPGGYYPTDADSLKTVENYVRTREVNLIIQRVNRECCDRVKDLFLKQRPETLDVVICELIRLFEAKKSI